MAIAITSLFIFGAAFALRSSRRLCPHTLAQPRRMKLVQRKRLILHKTLAMPALLSYAKLLPLKGDWKLETVAKCAVQTLFCPQHLSKGWRKAGTLEWTSASPYSGRPYQLRAVCLLTS